MAIKGAQKARWTLQGPIPEVTKLPKPWKLFGHPYPPNGNEVLATDGRSVWADTFFAGDKHGSHVIAWCVLPKAPDLGLVWPEKIKYPEIPRLTPERIEELREVARKAQQPEYLTGGVLDSPDPENREWID